MGPEIDVIDTNICLQTGFVNDASEVFYGFMSK